MDEVRPHAQSARPPAGFVLLIALVAICAAGKAILHDGLDPDCFWHLRVADQLQRDGIGALVDDLAFASSKQPWTPYSWLAELGMKALWDWGDYRAAVIVQAMMEAAIMVLMAMACLEMQRQPQAGGEPKYFSAAIATFAGAFLTLAFLSFRPVTLAFVFLWACTWLVLRDRRLGERSIAICLLVPMTALLTNIHLFAFFVPAVVFAMLIGAISEQRRSVVEPREAKRRITRYVILLVAVTLAYLATPMLPGVLSTVFFYGSRDEMVRNGKIVEMQFFAKGGFGIAAAIIVAGITTAVATHMKRVRVGEMLCLIAGLALLFKYARFSPIYAMAAAPVLAATLPRIRDEVFNKRLIVAVIAIIVVVGAIRVSLAAPRRDQTLSKWIGRHGTDVGSYPCAATDFVLENVTRSTGLIINEFSWGGYLGWRLNGRFQVLMDGRTQVFPGEFWHAVYLDGEDARRKYLSNIRADAAVLPAKKAQFHDALLSFGWTSYYKDDQAEVFLPPVK